MKIQFLQDVTLLVLSPHRFYYLHNFLRAAAWVRELYADMLDPAEQQFLDSFELLPQPSQALLVRLILRRGPWFLEGKLAYEEIPNVRDAAAPLLNLGWLVAHCPMELTELFAIHTKADLLSLFPSSAIHRGMLKTQMLEVLRIDPDLSKPYSAWNPGAKRGAWRIMVGELCERLRLMFFGNLHQSWSEFVLADLGVFKYETVDFSSASRVFESRGDVDCYLAIHRCRQALDDAQDPEALLLEAEGCCSANPWLEARRAKLLLRIGQACERAQMWDLAERAYCQSSYPGARHRRMRVYERTDRHGDARALAQEAYAAPENEEERQLVVRVLHRLERRLGPSGDVIRAVALVMRPMRMDLELRPPEQPTAVEYLVRDHWSTSVAPVFYVENALINSLFGLLCWPAIFAPMPGAFFHPFQSGPADLDAPDFVHRRKGAFDACLAGLGDESYRDAIQQRFIDRHGVQSPFVFWGAISQEVLNIALECIPAEHLRLIFLRMLNDLKSNRTGFPDLVRLWPAERRYEFVEIKGPGDKLQDNQARWLQYFGEHGIPASVCHVRWREPSEAPPRAAVDTLRAFA